MSTSSSQSQTGFQPVTSNESHSDSDEDKLVIDDGCNKNIQLSPPSVIKAAICSPTQTVQTKKTTRKISSDIDPLGQILKMQTQLLKPGVKKMDCTSTDNAEKNEQLSRNPSHCQPTIDSGDSPQETPKKYTADRSRVNEKSRCCHPCFSLFFTYIWSEYQIKYYSFYNGSVRTRVMALLLSPTSLSLPETLQEVTGAAHLT